MENLFDVPCAAGIVAKMVGDTPEFRAILRNVAPWRRGAIHNFGRVILAPPECRLFDPITLVQTWRVLRFRDNCSKYNNTPHKIKNGNVFVALANASLCTAETFASVISHNARLHFAAGAVAFRLVDIDNEYDKNTRERMQAYSWFWMVWFPNVACNDKKCMDAAHDVGILTAREHHVFKLSINSNTFKQ